MNVDSIKISPHEFKSENIVVDIDKRTGDFTRNDITFAHIDSDGLHVSLAWLCEAFKDVNWQETKEREMIWFLENCCLECEEEKCKYNADRTECHNFKRMQEQGKQVAFETRYDL